MPVIEDMLRRICQEDVELGYVQGMNLVAAVFAVAANNDDDADKAYKRFSAFMRRVRGLWLDGFPLYTEGVGLFHKLASGKAWHRHLQCHTDASMYLPQAWLALFTRWLPLNTLVSCLDVFEEHGFAAILAATVAVLDHAGGALSSGMDLEALKAFFDDLEARAPSAEQLRLEIQALLPRALALVQEASEPHGRSVQLDEHPAARAAPGQSYGPAGRPLHKSQRERKLEDEDNKQPWNQRSRSPSPAARATTAGTSPGDRHAQEQQLLQLLQMQKRHLQEQHPFIWFTVGEESEDGAPGKENTASPGKTADVLLQEEAVSDLLRCLGFDGLLL